LSSKGSQKAGGKKLSGGAGQPRSKNGPPGKVKKNRKTKQWEEDEEVFRLGWPGK